MHSRFSFKRFLFATVDLPDPIQLKSEYHQDGDHKQNGQVSGSGDLHHYKGIARFSQIKATLTLINISVSLVNLGRRQSYLVLFKRRK